MNRKEIEELKKDLDWTTKHWAQGGPLWQTTDKSKIKIKEIRNKWGLNE